MIIKDKSNIFKNKFNKSILNDKVKGEKFEKEAVRILITQDAEVEREAIKRVKFALHQTYTNNEHFRDESKVSRGTTW